jgi:hypothetical protein
MVLFLQKKLHPCNILGEVVGNSMKMWHNYNN